MATATTNPVGSLDAAPSLDARNLIPARLERLQVPHGFFAELCGLTKVEFSRLINGVKPMSRAQTLKFDATLNDLVVLTRIFYPAKLAWDIVSIPQLIDGLVRQQKEFSEVLRGGASALAGER